MLCLCRRGAVDVPPLLVYGLLPLCLKFGIGIASSSSSFYFEQKQDDAAMFPLASTCWITTTKAIRNEYFDQLVLDVFINSQPDIIC
jgi:hypothetical protein